MPPLKEVCIIVSNDALRHAASSQLMLRDVNDCILTLLLAFCKAVFA